MTKCTNCGGIGTRLNDAMSERYACDVCRGTGMAQPTLNEIERVDLRQQLFDRWMKQVDRMVEAKAGLSAHDLPDCPYWDWYEGGMQPARAATKAIRSAGGGL